MRIETKRYGEHQCDTRREKHRGRLTLTGQGKESKVNREKSPMSKILTWQSLLAVINRVGPLQQEKIE